jgi:hypothetical protein
VKRAVRVGLVVLGAAMAVYGAASLTGGWLGTPPWWERTRAVWDLASPNDLDHVVIEVAERVPRPGRELISLGFASAGLSLDAGRARPRRRSGTAS